MNANRNMVQQFASECGASCKKLLARLARVRNAIAAEFRETRQANDRLVQLALNEAEALAWQTDYPHLLFPTLAREKVHAVAAWNSHQQIVRSRPFELSLTA
jgi:hypothetical protein